MSLPISSATTAAESKLAPALIYHLTNVTTDHEDERSFSSQMVMILVMTNVTFEFSTLEQINSDYNDNGG